MLVHFLRTILALTLVGNLAACQPTHHKAQAPTDPGTPIPSRELTTRLGRGFNLGNTFDAYDEVWQRHDLAHTRQVIDLYRAQGMQTVRLPVTWMEPHADGTLADGDGRLDLQHPRFADLVATIDHALASGLFVVMDTHHEHWLKKHYDGSAAMDATFATLWTEIATYFRDYPHQLIFEVLNEPEGKLGDYAQSQGVLPSDATGMALTRKLNEIGYAAIRATGGNNAQRAILIAPNGQGNHGQIAAVYPDRASLPGGGKDPYVLVTGHSYDPWEFCGQTGSNQRYSGDDTAALRADLDRIVEGIVAWSKRTGVGVYFGEYGVGRETARHERDSALVREYYRYLTQSLIDSGIGTAVWDDKDWFGVLNVQGDGYVFVPGLIDAIMGRPEGSSGHP